MTSHQPGPVSELRGTILSVWAHPDDETYLAAGLMAAAVQAGQRVVCVTATRGELGSTDPDRWPPGEAVAASRWTRARRWEGSWPCWRTYVRSTCSRSVQTGRPGTQTTSPCRAGSGWPW